MKTNMRKKRIGIIDADLVGRDKHRFPNLVCEKISAYWKEKGAEVELLLDYDNIKEYDEVYISKVFTDTPFPKKLKETKKIHIGGTGIYFDKAPNLPDEIEHHMPDYHLYDDWIAGEVEKAKKNAELQGTNFDEKRFMIQFKEYTSYSIGFMTRGCFRKWNKKCSITTSEYYSNTR